MADRIQFRRDTAANWATYNPILLEGEVGIVLDSVSQYKMGDGIHQWNDLPLRGFDGNIAQTKGSSKTSVMSQKAVSDAIDSFEQAILAQINEYQPIEITGDVTNAADEEDLTSENGLLKFKNRNSLNGKGMIILRRGKTFGEQLTQMNTIYVVQYDFNLSSANVTIPSGCTLLFMGGTISNGTITLDDTNIYPLFNSLSVGNNLTIYGTPAIGTYKYENTNAYFFNGTTWKASSDEDAINAIKGGSNKSIFTLDSEISLESNRAKDAENLLSTRISTTENNISTLNNQITNKANQSDLNEATARISTNEIDIAQLQILYNSLQQSKPVPVTSLPSTGQQQGVIYRLAGTTSYSDYMWNGSSWVLMATYNNAIDDKPMPYSENLAVSKGIFMDWYETTVKVGGVDIKRLVKEHFIIGSDGEVAVNTTRSTAKCKINKGTKTIDVVDNNGNRMLVQAISFYSSEPDFDTTAGFIRRITPVTFPLAIDDGVEWITVDILDTRWNAAQSVFVVQNDLLNSIDNKLNIEDFKIAILNKNDNYSTYAMKNTNLGSDGITNSFNGRGLVIARIEEGARYIRHSGFTAAAFGWWSSLPDLENQTNWLERNNSNYVIEGAKYVGIVFLYTEWPSEIHIISDKNEIQNISLLNNSVGENCFANGVRNNLKILAYGNSFMMNTAFYLSSIANGCGVNLIVGDLYTGGTNLDDHYAALLNNNDVYGYMKWEDGVRTVNQTGQTPMRGLTDERWDAIIVHQYTPWSEPFEPLLNRFINLIIEKIGYCPKIYINSTWAGHEDYVEEQYGFQTELEMWEYMLNACKGACKDSGIAEFSILPTGTAIQNARTLSWADSYNRFCNDNGDWHHLNPAGGFIAACTVFQKIVKPLNGVNCSVTTFRITEATNLPPSQVVQQGILVTDSNYLQLCSAAIAAVNNPNVITNIT